MTKLLLTLVFVLASSLSAHANNCSMKLNMGYGIYTEEVANNLQLHMEKELAKKGYIVTNADDAEFSLSTYYGNMMTTTDCFIYSASMIIENSGKQRIAEGSSEASVLRLLVGRGSIPKAMGRKAFKKLLKNLPTCEVLPE